LVLSRFRLRAEATPAVDPEILPREMVDEELLLRRLVLDDDDARPLIRASSALDSAARPRRCPAFSAKSTFDPGSGRRRRGGCARSERYPRACPAGLRMAGKCQEMPGHDGPFHPRRVGVYHQRLYREERKGFAEDAKVPQISFGILRVSSATLR
jgi:hypothetical protein